MSKQVKKAPKIKKPDLPPRLEELDWDASLLEEEERIENGLIKDQVIEGIKEERLSFKKLRFEGVTFESCSFRQIELVDVEFYKCDLSNVDLSDSIIHHVEWRDCKLLGMNVSGSTIRHTTFKGCQADYSAFGFA
ncbi:hypothetical protein B4N84_12625, partial [Flavobacterium sp. IR1]